MKSNFLGFTFWKSKDGWKCKPANDRKKRLYAKTRAILCRRKAVARPMKSTFEQLNWLIRGWINYYRIADMKAIMERMDRKIRLHIRMCYWKQWKTVKNRANHLYFLGMPKYWCWLYANTRKGYCKAGQWLGRWITNKLLNQKGLLCLVDHYAKVHTSQQLMLGL